MIELAGVMGMLMGPGGDAEAEEDEDRAGAGSAEDGADGLTDENLVLMSEDDDPERPPEWDYLPLDPWDDPPEEEDPAPDRGPRSSDDDSLLPPFLRDDDGDDGDDRPDDPGTGKHAFELPPHWQDGPPDQDPDRSPEDDPERPPEWDYLPLDPWDDPPEEEDPAPDRGPRSSDDDSLLPPFLRAIDGLQPVVPAAGGEGAGTGATLEGPDPASGALRVAYDPQDHPDPQLSVEPAGPDGAVRVLLDGAVIARLEDAEGLAAEDLALVARPGA